MREYCLWFHFSIFHKLLFLFNWLQRNWGLLWKIGIEIIRDLRLWVSSKSSDYRILLCSVGRVDFKILLWKRKYGGFILKSTLFIVILLDFAVYVCSGELGEFWESPGLCNQHILDQIQTHFLLADAARKGGLEPQFSERDLNCFGLMPIFTTVVIKSSIFTLFF